MGKEIRRVPPNWEHPKYKQGRYKPIHRYHYSQAIAEWIKNHELWLKGEHPDQMENPELIEKYRFYAQWAGSPPDVDDHLPDWDEEPTWYQAYENVSEGTPISPPFEYPEQLIDFLVNEGDFWGKKWSRAAAESFVKDGYIPSFVFTFGEPVDPTQTPRGEVKNEAS